jgi:Fe-S cluster biogenesis protein NfuA
MARAGPSKVAKVPSAGGPHKTPYGDCGGRPQQAEIPLTRGHGCGTRESHAAGAPTRSLVNRRRPPHRTVGRALRLALWGVMAQDEMATGDVSSDSSGSASAAGPLSEEERQGRLAALTELLDLVRPAVQSDGGDLILVDADVETGRVEVQLQGACSSCAISASTLQAGVSRILQERLPWVTEVVGGVDDSMDLETSAAMGRGGYVPGY